MGFDVRKRPTIYSFCTWWSLFLSAVLASETETVSESDVIVVGAGQAGMAAAHHLSGLGHAVRVLEATDHVGGRTRNMDVGSGRMDVATDDVIELGGFWFSPMHTAALSLCKELGISVYNASFTDAPDRAESAAVPGRRAEAEQIAGIVEDLPWWFWGAEYPADQMALLANTVYHGAGGRSLFRTPAEFIARFANLSLAELGRAKKVIGRAVRELGEKCWDVDGITPAWRRYDADTTGGFLRDQVKSEEARQVLRNCIHDHNAQEPEAVSFLYNIMSLKGCNSGGPDNQFRVRGGTQAIPLAVAAMLGDNVSLRSPVRSVLARPGPVAGGVTVHTQDGRQYHAAAVVVTGPPPVVLAIDFTPPLPGAQAQLLQRMPMGTSLKFAAVYRQGPWWRELGLQGDILATALPQDLSMREPGDEGIPLFVECYDHSPFSRRLGVVVCFVEGRQNLYFTSLPSAMQQALMLAFLRQSFNDSRAESFGPTFVAHDWKDQPYARGAYTGFFTPGVQSVPEYWHAYKEMEKLPGVFLAGSDYHTGFGNGYIEGAIRSGKRAAELVHARLTTQRVSASSEKVTPESSVVMI